MVSTTKLYVLILKVGKQATSKWDVLAGWFEIVLFKEVFEEGELSNKILEVSGVLRSLEVMYLRGQVEEVMSERRKVFHAVSMASPRF
jgi:hypothetical protein